MWERDRDCLDGVRPVWERDTAWLGGVRPVEERDTAWLDGAHRVWYDECGAGAEIFLHDLERCRTGDGCPALLTSVIDRTSDIFSGCIASGKNS